MLPSAEPHPEKPQVGQVWKTRGGTYVTITGQDAPGVFTCTTNHFIQRADLLEPVTYPKVPRLFVGPIHNTGTGYEYAQADDGTMWRRAMSTRSDDQTWQQVHPLPDREEPTND